MSYVMNDTERMIFMIVVLQYDYARRPSEWSSDTALNLV